MNTVYSMKITAVVANETTKQKLLFLFAYIILLPFSSKLVNLPFTFQ